jgi:hypothetical protein
MPLENRPTSKYKLPHCKTPGAILSTGYDNVVRGIVRGKKKPFRNAVSIDLSTVRKNVNVKLSKNKLHISGASCQEDVLEAGDHLVTHLIKIQGTLNKLHRFPDQTIRMINWVKNITMGPRINRQVWRRVNLGQVCVTQEEILLDNVIIRPLVYHRSQIIGPISDWLGYFIPENFDDEIVRFLLAIADDFIYHSDLCQVLDYLPQITSLFGVIPGEEPDDLPLSLTSHYIAMVNYNYSLGFEVDRDQLNELIYGMNGFISHYNNALADNVTVELPYVCTNEARRKKKKIPHHTFLIYHTGSVTQSGPGGEMMREVYCLFMATIESLRDRIEIKEIHHR